MAAKKQHKHNFEWKWLIVLGALLIVLAVAVFVNIKTVDRSTDTLASSIAIDNSDLNINWNRYQTINTILTERKLAENK